MRKKLLHTLGYDTEGKVVHVSNTEKGGTYTCPQCGDRIIARNGGKMQRPHFAHFKKSSLKCNGNSILHHLLLTKATEILQAHVEQKKDFILQWSCPYCSKSYSKDLLQQVESIATSQIIQGHGADILLMGKENTPLIAIEILVNRRLTKKVIEMYDSMGIILIQIHATERSWEDVTHMLQHPYSVSFCSNKECYNFQFNENIFRREIYRQKFKCKKCGKVVDGYMVKNTSAFGLIGLDNLRDNEKQEIVSTYFRGKRATVADILVYGKCHCIPHSKGLVCMSKSDDFKEARQGKITHKK